MSNIEHLLYLRSVTGDLLTVLSDGNFVSLSYGLKEIEPGVLEFTLPGDFDMTLLAIDNQVEIYREIANGSLQLEGDTAWFIRKVKPLTTQDGLAIIQVTAFSALEIMQRRIVAYFSGTSYTDKEKIPWDDMLREIVDENYGPGASYGGDPARNLEPWLVVEPDYSWGVSYTRSMPWRNILNVLQDIVADVRGTGIYCSFDVIRIGPGRFEYRVFLGARGADHSSTSSTPVIVSEDRKNLLQPALDFDWSSEFNFAYGTGQGQGDQRIIKTAADTTRINISPFNRREFNRDARQAEIADSVQAEANSALEEGRPKRTFTGLISQTEGCLYGVHWKWGDIVTAEYKGISIDCHVDAVTVMVDASGTEVVTGYLRSVEDV
jgi:hypothetical protein